MGRSVHQPPSARNACQARNLDLCQSFLVRAARSIRSGQDTFTGCGHVCGVLHRSSHAPLRAQGPIDSLWLPINHHKACAGQDSLPAFDIVSDSSIGGNHLG